VKEHIMTDENTQQGRHIDFEAAQESELDEFELIGVTEPGDAYGPAWRERFATRKHLHNSITRIAS
jgi:hypothetical protein